ncbi:unnamed protein product, partial [Amoebophrya sp. A120]
QEQLQRPRPSVLQHVLAPSAGNTDGQLGRDQELVPPAGDQEQNEEADNIDDIIDELDRSGSEVESGDPLDYLPLDNLFDDTSAIVNQMQQYHYDSSAAITPTVDLGFYGVRFPPVQIPDFGDQGLSNMESDVDSEAERQVLDPHPSSPSSLT